MTWPFHNYQPQADISDITAANERSRRATKNVAAKGLKPLPKRSLPEPKQEPKTDRIRRSNSKV